MNRDLENTSKAKQSANLLRQDLQSLIRSDNPLLADIAMQHLETAASLENALSRLEFNLIATLAK